MSNIFSLNSDEKLPSLSIKTGLLASLLDNNEKFLAATGTSFQKGDLYISGYMGDKDNSYSSAGTLVLNTGNGPMLIGHKPGPANLPLVGQGANKAPAFSNILHLGTETTIFNTDSAGSLSIYGGRLSRAILKYSGDFDSNDTSIPKDTIINLPIHQGEVQAVWSPQASTNVGSTTKPVFISADGKVNECSTYAGGTAVTLNGESRGTTTASFYAPTAVGTAGYILKSGGTTNKTPVWIQSVPIANGGTGATALTANRLLYATSSAVTASGHYIDGDQLFVSYSPTSIPTALNNIKFYVNGASQFNGKIIGASSNYGPSLPTSNLTVGQIYFKLL